MTQTRSFASGGAAFTSSSPRERAAIRPVSVPTSLCVVAVAAWLTGTAYAFWAWGLKDRRPFSTDAQIATFDADARRAAAEAWYRTSPSARAASPMPASARSPHPAAPAAGRITVVALYARGCACNRATREHASRIAERYAARGVAVVDAPAETAPVDAAPSALVFDANGRLAYYGPYSDDAFCGAGRDGFVERTLDALLAGRTTPLAPVIASGCYCDVAPARRAPALPTPSPPRQTT